MNKPTHEECKGLIELRKDVNYMQKEFAELVQEHRTASKTMQTIAESIPAKPDPAITKAWLMFWGGLLCALIVHAPKIIEAIKGLMT